MSAFAELSAWADAQGREPECHNYGRHPDQVADLLLPEPATLRPAGRPPGRLPVVVLLHGGFWRQPYDRSLMHALAVAFAQRGWASWNVEYRRGPGAGGAGTALADVRAAISLLRLIPEPLDLKRVVVLGHSAGGHLALCAAATARARLVVSLAGVTDLVAAVQARLGADAAEPSGTDAAEPSGPDAATEFIGASPAEDPAAYAAANPIAMLPTGAATLLVHGDRDDRVPVSQSRAYLAAARAAGDRCELLELPGVDHFALIDPRTAAFAAYADRLEI
jgi:acetyl esterase/lipase